MDDVVFELLSKRISLVSSADDFFLLRDLFVNLFLVGLISQTQYGDLCESLVVSCADRGILH